MNNRDLLKAIGDIDDKYLIEENNIGETNRITTNNMVEIMRKLKLKYILAPVCMLIIAAVGYVGFLNTNNNLDESLKADININKIKDTKITKIDADVKVENEFMIPYFEFLADIAIPKDFDNKEYYRAIYIRSDMKVEKYDILNNYEFEYHNTSNDRRIKIAFSDKYIPLRDYEIDGANKTSKIGDTELVICQYNSMYIAKFTHNGINFDIETTELTENELILLLESIIIKSK